MKIIMCLLFITQSCFATAQPITENSRILYGVCTKDSLIAEPYGKWFNTNYDSYEPAAGTVASLKKQTYENITVKIFFGTWCGDSKREVPRFLKLLSAISFPKRNCNWLDLEAAIH